jgi:hypothetical protein
MAYIFHFQENPGMKRPSFTWLKGIILLGLGCALGGAVLAFQAQANLNSALTLLASISDSTSQIGNDLADIAAELYAVDTQLGLSEQSARSSLKAARDKNSAVVTQNETLAKSESEMLTTIVNSRTSLQTGLGITLLGVFLLFVGFILTFIIDGKVGAVIDDSFEQGKLEGRQEVAMALDKNPSALLNMYYWVRAYRQGKGTSESALHIFEQFFARMQEKLGLRPYGSIGEILLYDHKKHDNRSAGVKHGDRVRVIEVGWQTDNFILRKPMVEKERS